MLTDFSNLNTDSHSLNPVCGKRLNSTFQFSPFETANAEKVHTHSHTVGHQHGVCRRHVRVCVCVYPYRKRFPTYIRIRDLNVNDVWPSLRWRLTIVSIWKPSRPRWTPFLRGWFRTSAAAHTFAFRGNALLQGRNSYRRVVHTFKGSLHPYSNRTTVSLQLCEASGTHAVAFTHHATYMFSTLVMLLPIASGYVNVVFVFWVYVNWLAAIKCESTNMW